jgi:hypothetical protein
MRRPFIGSVFVLSISIGLVRGWRPRQDAGFGASLTTSGTTRRYLFVSAPRRGALTCQRAANADTYDD